ncbi:unnamed protein product [Ceutorhynchus assimilis]|uniref:ABC transporter domain-containing protein n=1 Tax=Ceutorhynchus assimilis TaxID=467358 RepID=A0A9P0DD13_9CUCU|nr:unnamed protein product [Ceutorhynchus assimilis]
MTRILDKEGKKMKILPAETTERWTIPLWGDVHKNNPQQALLYDADPKIWMKNTKYDISRLDCDSKKTRNYQKKPSQNKSKMWKHQLRAILWKNFLIRKRHWLLTIMEATIPILIFLMAAYGRSKITSISKVTIQDVTINEKEEITFDKPGFDLADTLFFYSPSNEYFDDLIHRVQEKFQVPSNTIQGFKNEHRLLEQFAKTSNSSVIPIIFHSAAGSPNLEYTIRQPQKRSSEDFSWETSQMYSNTMGYRPGMGTPYLYQGFLALQKSIDMSFIEKEKEKQGGKLPKTDIQLQEFPYPPYKLDSGMSNFFMNLLPLMTLFSFLFVIPLVLKRIVEEKYTGIKELMKMVGIQTWMLWLGWFIHSVLPMLVSITFIVILLKVDIFEAGYAAIEYTDGTILFAFLLLYIFANTIVCFFISTWTHRPFLSTLLGQLFLIVLSYILPKFLIGKKPEVPFSTSILLMLFPNMGLHYGFLAIQQYEVREIGVNWSNFHQPGANGSNDISMFNVFVMQIIDCFIYMLLALYVDAINPGKYGMPKSIFFPFKKLLSFFKGHNDVDIEKGAESFHLQDHEKSKLTKGIELIDLQKKYGKKTVVKKLKMEIYQDQITVLLGHNGAGKSTTMGMITGMIKKTAGTIIINGKEVQSRSDITESLGLCPQENLFFPTLTVAEHLMFFAMLKGKSCQESEHEIQDLLPKLHLSDKKDSLAHKLSGGMKRKLCLGMAVVGGSKILILDEPSSGMDPQSRREMWDLLHNWRNEKTILITTHFMEEADALGDWIAIMNEGELKCYGTPMYLKKLYETGSNLILLIKKDKDVTEAVENLEKVIKTEFNSAKCKGINGHEVRFLLPEGNYIKLFEFLESNKDKYGIENISFTCTTLEDVFLSPKVTEHEEDDEYVNSDLRSIARSKESAFYLTLKALLFKRYQFIFRKSMFYIIPTLVAFLFIGLCVYMGSQKQDYTGDSGPPLKMSLSTYGKTTVYLNTTGDSEIGKIYERLVSDQNGKLNFASDVSRSIIAAGTENLPYYHQHMIAAAEISTRESRGQKIIEAVALFNNFPLHSAPISFNLLTNTIAKYTLGDQYSILTTNYPLGFKNKDNATDNVDVVEIIILWLAVMPWGFLFFVGSFIYFPYVEMSTKFTQLQFMCGVRPAVYWLTTFAADFVIYLLFALVMCLIYTLCWTPFRGIKEFGALYLVLALYGACAIPYSYLFARLKSFASAYSHFITIGSFTGSLLTIGVMALQEVPEGGYKQAGNILNVIFLITCPQYGLIYWGLRFSLKVIENYNFDHSDELRRLVICSSDQRNPCCDGIGPACDAWKSYRNSEIYYMLLCAVIYLLVNMILDSYLRKRVMNWIRNIFTKHYNRIPNPPDTAEELADHGTLRVKKLKKFYSGKQVVKDVSLNLKKGQCLGILGVNGAGKTTTFKMLTREEVKDNGDIKINAHSVENDEYLKRLGYCPQNDALNYSLTGRDILKTMAMLRGIQDDLIVDQFLDLFGLKKIADIKCEHYSGGNKRRLSFAVAVIGFPDFILLDEPTNGVDPLSRRKFWSLIKKIRDMKQNSFILTSHSMAECEAVCNDLKIMKEGTIKKEGPIAQLKNEVCGFNVMLKLKQGNDAGYDDVDGGPGRPQITTITELKDHLQEKFPTGKIRDEHSGMIHYYIESKEKRWSQLFGLFEELKLKSTLIEDYAISEASLEDVFLNVARNDDDNDEEEKL